MSHRPGRTRLVALVALVGGSLLALLAPSLAAASPDPVAPVISTTATTPVVPIPATQADRVDRSWPRNPPWDACPRPVWPGERSSGSPGAGRRVLIIGDSLTRDSRVTSARLMRKSGWTPTFRCWGSTRLDWGLAQVARSRQLAQLPGFVIMALGTNDISWETPQTTERRLRLLLDRLGPKRQVLWVDLHLTRSAWLDARADWFNDLLRRLERTHRNLTVVDWHRQARAHGIRGWDGIHYGPSGYVLRAKAVAAALDAVGRQHPVQSAVIGGQSPTPLPTATAAPTPASSATPGPGPSAAPTGSASPTPGTSVGGSIGPSASASASTSATPIG